LKNNMSLNAVSSLTGADHSSRRNDYMGFIPNAEAAAIAKSVRVSFKLSNSWCKYNGTPKTHSLFLVHFV
ncbi:MULTISPECIES: hypothetical protein, partial [unclassified Vibrio]|uniref:hypothetical protein n=1 Tax=unclassified Vibrio TaxID=2614977 RepID=UPI00352F817C